MLLYEDHDIAGTDMAESSFLYLPVSDMLPLLQPPPPPPASCSSCLLPLPLLICLVPAPSFPPALLNFCESRATISTLICAE
eukprot:335339-Hanusia_phi.AAC.2